MGLVLFFAGLAGIALVEHLLKIQVIGIEAALLLVGTLVCFLIFIVWRHRKQSHLRRLDNTGDTLDLSQIGGHDGRSWFGGEAHYANHDHGCSGHSHYGHEGHDNGGQCSDDGGGGHH